jgi:hypothetical protein
MANVWSLDPNIEFYKPIKQRCFPAQTAIDHLGRRFPFAS